MSEPQLWGGRFQGALHPIFEELNRSLPFDRRFVFDDLAGRGPRPRCPPVG